jgi:hypothetical protein
MFSARPLTRKKNENLFSARAFRLLIYRAYQPGRGWSDLVRGNYPVRSEIFHAAFRAAEKLAVSAEREMRISILGADAISLVRVSPSDSAIAQKYLNSIRNASATRFIGALLRHRLGRAASRRE